MNSVLVDSEFMNTVFKFNPELLSKFPKNPIGEFCEIPNFFDLQTPLSFEENESKPCLEPPDLINWDTLSLDQNLGCNTGSDIPDFPDDCLKFISDILLEEHLDENPASAQEFRALQATEKSLYDVLGESYPHSSEGFPESLNPKIESPDSISSHKSDTSFEPCLGLNPPQLESIVNVDDFVHSFLELNPQSSDSSSEDSEDRVLNVSMVLNEQGEKQVKGSKRKKSRQRDETDLGGGRSNKIQAASSDDDYVEMKEYDDVLLCGEYTDDASFAPNECSLDVEESKLLGSIRGNQSSGRSKGKRRNNKIEEVDLRALLIQCAQAVSSFDLKIANDLLKKIRQHCTPYGDSIQKTAFHFANGLEARLAGTGSTVSTSLSDMKISSSEFLKAYRLYVSAIPFKRMSFFLANSTILKMAEKASKIHIIDFGIFLGLQWPCLIQSLSKRPNGPPKLRITGVDSPQQGFRPAERVNAAGRRLSGYCERFGVPFEYQGIAEKWENIRVEELKIESDEMVFVNCMFRSGTLHDETVEASSPRDGFLRLVRNLNPDLFIHGILNGAYTAPFFTNRFKEALFHYSSLFEVFDATLPRDAHERLRIENEVYSEVYGKEVINVVACEGVERVQRPETYKQWNVRSARAGLRQVPLDREFLSKAKAMVKANYHQDFLVDEDRNWMLQGWKGRISYALSFWQASS